MPMYEISKMLRLNIRHLSADTRLKLEERADHLPFLAVADKSSCVLTVNYEEDQLMPVDVPEDMQAVLELAGRQECAFVRLDRDGPTTAELHVYDDEGIDGV